VSDSKRITHIDADRFDEVVLKGGKVVVDFYSDECPPCEALAPKFDSFADNYGDEITFVKIFRQKNRELATQLGVSSSPTVLFFENGVETGKRFSGAIKRSDLQASLDPWISAERKSQVLAARKVRRTECEILILGAGPAGLTAAIYAAQAKKKTILVDRGMPGGQVSTTHLVANYPGFSEPVPGYLLAHHMHQQAIHAGAEFRLGVDLTSVDLADRTVEIDGGEEVIYAKKVIVALGASYKPMGIPGEKEFSGRGISYCSTCDAKFYEGKDVIVIGGGDSALEEGIVITNYACRVRVMHRRDAFRAHADIQERARANEKMEFLLNYEPLEFRKTASGMEVLAKNTVTGQAETFAADGIFVFIGMRPNMAPLPTGLLTDDNGYVKVDALMRTNLPNVFAVGDIIAKPFRQISVAVAEGTVAGIQAAKELDFSVATTRID